MLVLQFNSQNYLISLNRGSVRAPDCGPELLTLRKPQMVLYDHSPDNLNSWEWTNMAQSADGLSLMNSHWEVA